MITGSPRAVLILIAAQLALTGCRTYGDYGAVDKTVAEVERINEQFERNLARAQIDLSSMSEAAAQNPVLAGLAQEFEQAVADHEQQVVDHARDLAALKAGFVGYRAASRLFGSIVTDQHATAHRYSHIARRADEIRGGARRTLRRTDTYQHVPPYYLRVEHGSHNASLRDVLRAVR